MTRLFSIMGDSISTFAGSNPEGYTVFYTLERAKDFGLASFHDTWWSQVIDYYHGELLVNGSWSGSMVEGAGFPAASSRERVEALSRNGLDPDDILVFIGINDYGWGGMEAQAAGRSHATPPSTDLARYPPKVAGMAPNDALYRFKDAYRSMLLMVRDRYPLARVWCCTLLPGRLATSSHSTHTWNLRGIEMSAYCEAIVEVSTESGCTPLDVTSYGLDYEALDGTHPTNLGMRQLAALVIAAMEGRGAPDCSFFSDKAFQESNETTNWASTRNCAGRACVGCSWARGTGNEWFCVCNQPMES